MVIEGGRRKTNLGKGGEVTQELKSLEGIRGIRDYLVIEKRRKRD